MKKIFLQLNDAISGNVDAFFADKANLLCDAVNPDVSLVTTSATVPYRIVKVEKALKAVYSSNGVYWLAESMIFAKAFGPQEPTETEKTLAEVCSEGWVTVDYRTPTVSSQFRALRENAYGKCVCQQDSGFIYCIYKVFAESFISEGEIM